MTRIEQTDDGAVVIIGSGAGGGTLAHELTRRGIKVVLLEAGQRQSLGRDGGTRMGASPPMVPGCGTAQRQSAPPGIASGLTETVLKVTNRSNHR